MKMNKDFSKLIIATARRYANSREDFEDLVQEGHLALLELLKGRTQEKIKKTGELMDYVKKRLPGMMRSKARKLWKYREESKYDFKEEFENISDPRAISDFEIVDFRMFLENILKKDVEILRHFLAGKTQQQIGEILGMTQQAISKKMKIMKEKIKEALNEE
ncbi:RNA polymerase sigma factor, sigma-70 family [Thermovirga lienii DSM 17291]|jgi:RNA polymerase sigma factor (sigma-70 family)|uniref:RNA polymerase sigma factor, sigma-70 family n=1 Tax=Thermovirga lienii (strain ATCC BAA-1197 / DSM 17291 / Cas60314) TaxID=580340 RepID=G7V906_THELD|nr:sigma-70 family RNA polymerase sigma factor [Thermovirga lienii]AER67540.1 RNA polymerase sigma factor, sigma-70 family [Thermovirga lienii DSM 17291]